jgi:hypothetical protein
MAASVHTVCPYFTMFPIEFPVRVLQRAQSGDSVLDPFCGRGTTNYAARSLGLASVGIDSSPVAAAIAKAKLPRVQPEAVVRCAHAVLATSREGPAVPRGAFWRWAFHEETLTDLCAHHAELPVGGPFPAHARHGGPRARRRHSDGAPAGYTAASAGSASPRNASITGETCLSAWRTR